MLPASVELKGNLLEEPANIVSPALQFGFYFSLFFSAHPTQKFTLENRTVEWVLGQPSQSFARVFVLYQASQVALLVRNLTANARDIRVYPD